MAKAFPELCGQWSKKTNTGGTEVIYVIEIDGNMAKAVGKNIPVDELKSNWTKVNDDFGDPFKSMSGMQGMDRDLIREQKDTIEPPEVKATKVDDVGQPKPLVDDLGQPEAKVYEETKPEEPQPISGKHKFIHDAIKMQESKNKQSKLSLNFELVIPCDINKLKIVANSMDIEYEVVSDVIMELLQGQTEDFFNQVSKAVSNNLRDDNDRAKQSV